MYRFTIVFCLVVLVSCASLTLADIPKLINYQGMLTEPDGTTPVQDGTYNLGFKIYGSQSGTDSLWQEYHSSVQVTNGLFNIILGSQSLLNLPFDADYWLETIVETEIMPTRLQFTSVGYAYRAKVADSAAVVGSGGAGGWVDDGAVVRLQSSTDRVGIGTASPGAKLQVGDGSSDDRIRVMGSTAAVSAEIGSHLDGFGYLKINDDGGTPTALIDPEDGVSYIKYGKVGIGTTSPQAGLHLKGAGFPSSFMYLQSDSDQDAGIRLNEGADVRWHIFNSSADSGLRIYNSDGSKTVFFAEQSSGNVGVETTSPHSTLHVNGSMARAYKLVTASTYSPTGSDCIIAVYASAHGVSVHLPSAAGITGRAYTIKKTDATPNSVVVGAGFPDKIDGLTQQNLLSQWEYITVVSDGSNWLIIGRNY